MTSTASHRVTLVKKDVRGDPGQTKNNFFILLFFTYKGVNNNCESKKYNSVAQIINYFYYFITL